MDHETGLIGLFIFWWCHMSCGVLVPQPGVEPALSELEAQNLNHWTTNGGLELDFLALLSSFQGLGSLLFLPLNNK